MKDVWERCLAIVRANVPQSDYEQWFAPLKFRSLKDGVLTLEVPDPNISQRLTQEQHLKHLFYNIVWRTFGQEVKIAYSLVSKPKARKPAAVIEEWDPHLNHDHTFANYVEGEGNKLLRSVGLSIAQHPKQSTFNPLFVYGDSGVGKTHLANAIGVEYQRNHPQGRVLYVTADQFKVQYTTAVTQNHTNDFVHFSPTTDLRLIDDVQEFAGLEGTQNAFFHIFNHLKMNGKHIILTADRSPSEMPHIEDRLVTRFRWGLSEQLAKPDYRLCRNILERRIKQDELNIPEEVVDYVARKVTGSIRDLEGILSALMARSLVLNQEINLALARRVVEQSARSKQHTITIEMITQRVCDALEVNEADIMAQTRKAKIVTARQMVMHLSEKHTKLSLTAIGRQLGGRNHATVIHGIKQIRGRLEVEKALAQKASEIEAYLK